MEQDLLNLVSQFGAAGLIGWMWLSERRHTAKREQQLTEAHDRIGEQRIALDQLLSVIAENTRAVASLEAGQRALLSLLESMHSAKTTVNNSEKTDARTAA